MFSSVRFLQAIVIDLIIMPRRVVLPKENKRVLSKFLHEPQRVELPLVEPWQMRGAITREARRDKISSASEKILGIWR
jgi:hypothetical protein